MLFLAACLPYPLLQKLAFAQSGKVALEVRTSVVACGLATEAGADSWRSIHDRHVADTTPHKYR